MKSFIKKGDKVVVISGKDKKKTGKVLRVLGAEERLVVEGVNSRKKMRRPRRQGEKGQIIQIEMPVHKSSVMLLCPQCGRPTRRAFSLGEKRTRLCKKCQAVFD